VTCRGEQNDSGGVAINAPVMTKPSQFVDGRQHGTCPENKDLIKSLVLNAGRLAAYLLIDCPVLPLALVLDLSHKVIQRTE
jgi:hypothetical protein